LENHGIGFIAGNIRVKVYAMNWMVSRFWGIVLGLAFRGAQIALSITNRRICGAMVAVWYANRILLVRKSYRKGWSFPGGLLKRGETWERAAARETFEEVGIRVDTEALAFVAEVPGGLGPDNPTRLFEIEIPGPACIRVDGREIVRAEFFEPERARKQSLSRHVARYLESHPTAQR
jgi:8-oxo-dGTP pyrophosphatase MutT (NUDIX family)